MHWSNRYKIGDLGSPSCPAGRLMYDVPTFTGRGGGGSGDAAADAADKPVAVNGAAAVKKKH